MADLVSVIIPVYNVAAYLKECVASVCMQTYSHLEIILIDDGSTDRSGELCDELAREDARIKVYHQENGGLSLARNRGIEKSSGKYLYFVDSDDFLIDKHTLERMVTLAETYEVSLVLGAYVEVYEDRILSFLDKQVLPQQVLSAKQLMKYMYDFDKFKSNFIVAHNKLCSRSLFEGCLFPVGKLHEDEFTTYKLYLKAGQALWLNEETYGYRIRNQSIINGKYSLSRLDVIEAFEERVQVLQEAHLPIVDTVGVLLSHLSYHQWRLAHNGYSKEAKVLSSKFKAYYQEYSHFYKGKQRVKLFVMRYANLGYRFVKNVLYAHWKSLRFKKA